MTSWILHNGGDCPVDHAAVVRVRLRDGFEYTCSASNLNWRYGTTIWEMDGKPMPPECEIIAYKLERLGCGK
jgi:hypothetical protein